LTAKVLVVGAGAIGAFYAAVLARGGCEVSVVARGDFDAVSKDGYAVDSVLGDLSFRPARVLRSAGEWQGEADFVFVALKHVRGTDRAALIRPAVSPGTAIVLVQNGIDVEQEIVDAFPANELVSGIAYAAASRDGPGRIRHHSKFTRLVVGNYPSGTSATTARVAALVKQGGGSCVETNDIVGARWQKCTWNTVFNPVSALGGGLGTGAILATEPGRDFVREAIREVCAVARAAGHPLAENTAETQIEGTLRMGDYVSSMGQDYLAGRPMEIEPLIGNAVRAAQRLSVPVPRLQGLYAMLLMLERKGVH
jgi:2-dehydropantoate 2-reductase